MNQSVPFVPRWNGLGLEWRIGIGLPTRLVTNADVNGSRGSQPQANVFLGSAEKCEGIALVLA